MPYRKINTKILHKYFKWVLYWCSKKFCYKIGGEWIRYFIVSYILIYNITEWSQFTKGTIYLGMENIQEDNTRITCKTTYKKIKITLEWRLKQYKKMTTQVA